MRTPAGHGDESSNIFASEPRVSISKVTSNRVMIFQRNLEKSKKL
ncbi:hypothetical protein RESH_01781 [Rhodopirellula europaea SH398]|uniref:Uncharacterized protein n=1 Tax=Rhodopirellula europaea SH398 TaxID=1263868 RepID=M5SN31_9BACT|nr:hypothetical protein RESH_01781 [Rhodopirellula europaea SH398]